VLYYAEQKFKIVLVGDCNVGKTALLWRGTTGLFPKEKRYDSDNDASSGSKR
jgi:GTPase SAR1 family protein